MKPNYSRKGKIEQKKNVRSAFFLILLTVALIASLVMYGIPLIVKYTGFLLDIKSSESPVSTNDTTAPPPPKIDNTDSFTNHQDIDINGTAEEGSTVKITTNGNDKEVLANKFGRFSVNISLYEGENVIFATAKDARGNESAKSEKYTIIFDKEPPTLEISNPEDGKTFFGSSNRKISIEGKVDSGTRVSINSKFVILKNDGSFSFPTTLTSGENKFDIKAEDSAGNTTEKSIIVNFSE